jgi:thiosulfate reductase cytochrome b subunit
MTINQSQSKSKKSFLELKHPLAIRWFHWINFPVIAIMLWSGLMIFWANAGGIITFRGHPVFPDSFYQPHAPAWWPTVFPHYTDSTGIYLYTLKYRLAEAQGWHFTFFWLFMINGLLYAAYLLISREYKYIAPHKESFKRSVLLVLHELHILKKAPDSDGKYNDAQRIAYTGVILLGAIMLLSGLAIYKPTQLYWLTYLMGGYRFARWLHFWTSMVICAFFAVHIFQVVKAGWNNFRSMVIGFSLEGSARTPSKQNGVELKETNV